MVPDIVPRHQWHEEGAWFELGMMQSAWPWSSPCFFPQVTTTVLRTAVMYGMVRFSKLLVIRRSSSIWWTTPTYYQVVVLHAAALPLAFSLYAYCSDITDDSLRSLSKCLNLDTLEIRGCPQVSSVGISAIAVGCRQLTKLDVKKCYDINDDGMLSLGRFSQNLRQVQSLLTFFP